MGLFSKNKEKNKKVDAIYTDGISRYTKGGIFSLTIDDDNQCLNISSIAKNNIPKVNLNFDRIVYIGILTDREIVEKSKSTIGRAVVGGLVLGSLGAIIGGMSGVGNKKETKLHSYIIINYKSKDGDIKAISFETKSVFDVPPFIKDIRSKIVNEEEIYL